mmetsp:Transcript_20090/g.50223  ORF Transcript_20090/g.50223 Transcript_20090/m.50223 type:complete len:205 (+) Transcript_20090:583-1197(+)
MGDDKGGARPEAQGVPAEADLRVEALGHLVHLIHRIHRRQLDRFLLAKLQQVLNHLHLLLRRPPSPLVLALHDGHRPLSRLGQLHPLLGKICASLGYAVVKGGPPSRRHPARVEPRIPVQPFELGVTKVRVNKSLEEIRSDGLELELVNVRPSKCLKLSVPNPPLNRVEQVESLLVGDSAKCIVGIDSLKLGHQVGELRVADLC